MLRHRAVLHTQRIGRVSSEWFSRPVDERYLSLSELMASANGPRRPKPDAHRGERGGAGRGQSRQRQRLALVLPGSDVPVAPTHWSFGQLAALVGAPAAYLRQF